MTLASQIDWHAAIIQLSALHVEAVGRHGVPIRLMVGLYYLKHAFKLSGALVVSHWVENPYWVRRESSKVYEVKVHYDEGMANHIGPESCVLTREGAREASVGGRVD